MEKHVTALGALFVAFGLMGLVGMAVVFLIFVGGGVAGGLFAALEAASASSSQATEVSLAALLTTAFGLFLTLIIAVSTVPSLIVGYGLLARRTWAPVGALIVGIVNLPAFPVGTVTGIYAIWVYVQEGTAGVMVPRARHLRQPAMS